MRALLAGELADAQSWDSEYYTELEIKNASGTWKNIEAVAGTLLTVNAQWGENRDQNVASATITILADVPLGSLAPLISASPINVDDASAYAPLLNPGRLFRFYTATMASGVTLDVTKYREAFTGKVDSVTQVEDDNGYSKITLSCSDLGAWLGKIQIKTPGTEYGGTVTAGAFVVGKTYTILTVGSTNFVAIGASASTVGIIFTATGVGSGTGTANRNLETVIQNEINAWIPVGEPSVTLYKQSSSNYAVTRWAPDEGSLFPNLQQLVLDSVGEDLRYRYDSSHVSKLTWFKPSREAGWSASVAYVIGDSVISGGVYYKCILGHTNHVPPNGTYWASGVDATFTKTQYRMQRLDLSDDDVRNTADMSYTDTTGASGTVHSVDTASVAIYREQYSRIPSSDLIQSEAEAQTVADAYTHDVGVPPGEAVVVLPYCWFVQLYDRDTFAANGKQYDTDQTFAVGGYQHSIENGRGTTTLTPLTSRIVGAYAKWQGRISDVNVSATPSTPIVTTWFDADRHATIALKGVSNTKSFRVPHNQNGTIPTAGDVAGWSYINAVNGEASFVVGAPSVFALGDILNWRARGYSEPNGVGLESAEDASGSSTFTYVTVGVAARAFPHDIAVPYSPVGLPALVSVTVDTTFVTVTGNLYVKSYNLSQVGGTWESVQDGPGGRVDVSNTGTNGVAGITGSSNWTVQVCVYSEPKVEVDSSTPSDCRNVTVFGPTGSDTLEPKWSIINASAPSVIGSFDTTLQLKASSAPAGYTAKVYARYQINSGVWTSFTEITSSLSPSLSTPPTSSTTYTYTLGTHYALSDPPGNGFITYEFKADILNGSSVVVRSMTSQASWYYTY